jgi:redox-sensitive bicupin YhaK (pirin superfamily)
MAAIEQAALSFALDCCHLLDMATWIHDVGDQFFVSAASETIRLLLLTGKPLNEPVAWQGHIFMNTRVELELAFRKYREGTFIKNK